MSESDQHRSLVKALGGDIASDTRWSKPPIVYFDLQDGVSGEPPPAIGANRPDAFAREISAGRTIIGEAKTTDDIDNQHTRDQLSSYFLYLQSQRTMDGRSVDVCGNCPSGQQACAPPDPVTGHPNLRGGLHDRRHDRQKVLA